MDPLVESIVRGSSELTDCEASSVPIVMMTRIRLARNLADFPFPNRAGEEARERVFAICRDALLKAEEMAGGSVVEIATLNPTERQILVERHLVSRELIEAPDQAGVVINRDQSAAVMINEEDHLRLQAMLSGFKLTEVWKKIDGLDTALESSLSYAFSPDLGYLTACPTNVGTGIRASAMMHLPGLVFAKQMEQVIRAVNQIGLVVRGIFGEGSEASGSIFQISNQQTLGESEMTILNRLEGVLKTVVEQEQNARMRLLETEPRRVADKIGRAFGVLRNGHLLSSGEGMNLLSLTRMGVDYGIFPESTRGVLDRLFIETQPAHIQLIGEHEMESAERDAVRADTLRREFARIPEPDFGAVGV